MANIQVPELPTATELLDSDLLHVRQGPTDKKLTGEQAKLLFQGLSEWLPTSDYTVGMYIRGSDNKAYQCLQDNGPNSVVVNPPTDTDQGVWKWVMQGYGDTWTVTTTYEEGDVVREGTAYYRSLASANTGNTPSTSPTQWVPTSLPPVVIGMAGSQSGPLPGADLSGTYPDVWPMADIWGNDTGNVDGPAGTYTASSAGWYRLTATIYASGDRPDLQASFNSRVLRPINEPSTSQWSLFSPLAGARASGLSDVATCQHNAVGYLNVGDEVRLSTVGVVASPADLDVTFSRWSIHLNQLTFG